MGGIYMLSDAKALEDIWKKSEVKAQFFINWDY